jgi:methylsterol monooxygenase
MVFFVLPSISQHIWPKKITNKFRFHFLAAPIVHTLALIVYNLFFLMLYKAKLPSIEKYRCNTEKWPWEEDAEKWNILFNKTIKVVVFHNLVIVPISSFLVNLHEDLWTRLSYESLPSVPEYCLHMVICMLAEDFWSYWLHRLMHHKALYKHIHKVHHDHKVTVSLVAEYAHPIEFVTVNMFATMLGPLILRSNMHCFTQMCWIMVRIFHTTLLHCGYDFDICPSRLIPFVSQASFHDYHHLMFKDNYGSFTTIWDYLCGTVGKNYEKIKLKQ